MMRKVILCTVVSLFVFGGFVAGPWGLGPVGAGTAVAANCSDLPGVEACILIYPEGKVKLEAGKGKTLRKPKISGPGSPGTGEEPGKKKDRINLPPVLALDVLKFPYTQHDITIYGDKTCILWMGVWYCW